MTRVNFPLLLFGVFLTVSKASDGLSADDESVSICQSVAVCFDYEYIYNAMAHFQSITILPSTRVPYLSK